MSHELLLLPACTTCTSRAGVGAGVDGGLTLVNSFLRDYEELHHEIDAWLVLKVRPLACLLFCTSKYFVFMKWNCPVHGVSLLQCFQILVHFLVLLFTRTIRPSPTEQKKKRDKRNQAFDSLNKRAIERANAKNSAKPFAIKHSIRRNKRCIIPTKRFLRMCLTREPTAHASSTGGIGTNERVLVVARISSIVLWKSW